MSIPLSVLDLAPVAAGSSASDALRRTVELAQLADRMGYRRYWFAEHHSMPSIASSAPEILIAHVAAATSRIRVGAGGIMLPNHAPLRVAELFHTLEALHPGRIDLGLGRAPGTDPAASRALRPSDAEQFPQQLAEVMALSRAAFPEGHPLHPVRVVPSDVRLPPIWLLGSSGASAELAGAIGAGYAFASHFSHAPPAPAVQAYRRSFQPSEHFPEPHVLLGATVVCAETDDQADHLASSLDLLWVRLQRGELRAVPSPAEALAHPYTPHERAVARGYRALAIVGTPERVRAQLEQRLRDAGADEMIVSTIVYDSAARLRSYELLAQAFAP